MREFCKVKHSVSQVITRWPGKFVKGNIIIQYDCKKVKDFFFNLSICVTLLHSHYMVSRFSNTIRIFVFPFNLSGWITKTSSLTHVWFLHLFLDFQIKWASLIKELKVSCIKHLSILKYIYRTEHGRTGEPFSRLYRVLKRLRPNCLFFIIPYSQLSSEFQTLPSLECTHISSSLFDLSALLFYSFSK